MLGLVGRCPSIKSMELNVSFAIGNINELVNAVNKMVLYAVKPMRVSVTCVTYICGDADKIQAST